MRLLAPLLLAAALAAPVAADTPAKAAAFLGAMRDAGCDMSLDAADAAAEALGIEIDELDEIVDLLFVGGQMRIDASDHMTLLPALCEAGAAQDEALFARLQAEIDLDALDDWGAPDPRGLAEIEPAVAARFIGAIRAQDCAVTQAGAGAFLSTVGMTEAEARAALAALFEAGHVAPGAGWEEFRLSEALCAADPAGDAALYAAAVGRLAVPPAPADPDAVLAERFGPEGIRAVLEFLADSSDCVLDSSDRDDTIGAVVAFMAFNVTGIYNLPADFSPEAEADLRALVARMLDDPGPAFVAAPGQLTLIDCTP